jgi:uncharacterized membrane protein
LSIPPDQPSEADQPSEQPRPPRPPWRNSKLMGALAAVVLVILIPSIVALILAIAGSRDSGLIVPWVAPLVSLGSVFVGSILTVFESTRRFAIGFLIASSILIVVTAGVCVVALARAGGI